MRSLHFFNPGHETAVLLGSKNYTPPINVQIMSADLALLPVWYGDEGDYVLVGKSSTEQKKFYGRISSEFVSLPSPVSREELMSGQVLLPECVASPWGMSPQVLSVYQNLRQKNLEVPLWNETYKELTGRQTSAHCLRLLKEALPQFHFPDEPVFCKSCAELETFLERRKGRAWLLKSPYSSSGRGLLWLPSGNLGEKELAWVRNTIVKQGAVSVELALDKQIDFALEFYSDGKGSVRYEGLSVFGTGKTGAYSGNVLGSDSFRGQILFGQYLPEEELTLVRESLLNVLKNMCASGYRGCIGVDMLVYKDGNGLLRLHPCVEVNMRYTMGMLALRISRRYLSPDATGFFRVEYEKQEGMAEVLHREMEAQYPVSIKGGRICRGYFPLCPVTKDTHYRAYILID